MKKLFVLSVLTLLSTTSYAQLKLHSNGYLSFNTTQTPLSPISINWTGKDGYMVGYCGAKNGIFAQVHGATGSGERIGGFFMASPDGSSNYFYGVHGEAIYYSTVYNTGRAFGVYGIAGNATNGYNYALFGRLRGSQNGAAIYGTINEDNGVNTNGKYAGYFNGGVKVTGTISSPTYLTASDLRFMENVIPMSSTIRTNDETLNKVMNMNVIKYNHAYPPVEESDTNTVVAKRDAGGRQLHIGLSAQELREMYPELVYEEQDGSLSINYVELVPVLIRCIQELKQEMDDAKNASKSPSQMSRSTSSVESRFSTSAQLYQNSPNPFTERTEIRFSVPDDAQNAYIYIFDMTGKMLRQIPVDSSMQSVAVNGYELPAGIYLYSLVINGQEIDTKKMIITK